MRTDVRNLILVAGVAFLVTVLSLGHWHQSQRGTTTDAMPAHRLPTASNALVHPSVNSTSVPVATSSSGIPTAHVPTAVTTPASSPASPPKLPASLAVPEPERGEKPASRNKALGALLKASSLYCDFFSAHGALLVGGRLKMGSVSYQGGPLSYQAIDLASGTATMSGAQGVTGSVAGKLPMKVTPTDVGLTFTGIKHNGDIVVVTVYAVFDPDGNFPTVMSQHGAAFHFSTAQFYGACATSPTGVP